MPRSLTTRCLFTLCGLAWFLGIPAAHADPVISNIELGPTLVTLTFTDNGPYTKWDIERNPGLDPNNWSEDETATYEDLGGGQHRYTLARSAADREFFQIIGGFLGTATDLDGDQLPNVLETNGWDVTVDGNVVRYTSDPNLADSDRDGASDLQEYLNGTDPNDPLSFPDLAGLPRVQFLETLSSTTEGDGEFSIPIRSDRPIGNVRYSIHSSGTAVEGSDFQSIGSGTVSFNHGTSASIPITSIDNSNLDPERVIMIDLEVDGAETYRLGGRSRHILCLADNDHVWAGVLSSGLVDRNFRLERIRNGGSSAITFVAGDELDLEGGISSQTIGVIPNGRHSAVVTADSPTAFEVSIVLPAIQQSKLFGDKLNAVRILTLAATYNLAGPPDQFPNIQATHISGNYTEAVETDLAPGASTPGSGTFVLVQIPSAPLVAPTP